MRPIALLPVALAAVAVAAVSAVQDDPPAPAGPGPQHEWLRQLVGEWTVVGEATMAPGTEPMSMESTESVRSIGGLWILAEGSAEYFGAPFTSIMTLGYDPAQEAFVGTWIDSMQTHLWKYRGTLDDARKVLTLDTEGPSFDDPTRMARYRDVITLDSADRRLLTSSVRGEDGSWTQFMRAEYRRKE